MVFSIALARLSVKSKLSAPVSCLLNYRAISFFWHPRHNVEIATVIILAMIFTAVEIYGIRQHVFEGLKRWLAASLLMAAVSIFGSVITYQEGFEINIMQSDAYSQ